MLVPGDLGFSGLVLVFFLFFFFCPLISFLIQKKWRIAQAKKEEIMRLVAMAEEEAARAEFEANGVYDDFSVGGGGGGGAAAAEVVRPFKCAVCYCPTTTRCSRCKVVRYCSGKCQIIHWRRGHKEECHPPNINGTHLNGPGSDSDEGRLNTKPFKRTPKKSVSSKFMVSPELASGREDEEFEHLMDGKGAHIYSRYSDTSSVSFSTSTTSNESDTSSFPFSTSTTSNESLADGFTDGFSVCDSRSRSKGPQFDDVSPGVLENTIDVNDTNSLPSEFTGSVTSVNNISFPSKLKQKISACRPGANEYESTRYSGSNGLDECIFSVPSTCNSVLPQMNINMSSSANDLGDNAKSSEGVDDISLYSASLPHFPPIKPQIPKGDDVCPKSFRNRRPIQSEKMVRNGCTNGVSPSKPSKSLDTVDTDPSNDSQPQEFKGRRSLSSIASERHPCCGARRSSTSSVKPLKVDNAHTITTSLSEIASSLPNTSNGLKTSVRKAVQQFRVPKPSKHMPNGSSEISERNNYKMIFPYDLFVKLYKWGKVELRPCGLMNCGNSCYANAVLQCLAFTQPLTAYLLQGLHSKACPSKDWCFTCEFECLIQKASEGNSPLSPIGILSQLQSIGSHLGHGKEEDAHEFLRYAIDTMQSVCLKEAGVYALSPLAEETTLVGLIFGGYLRSKVKCMKCHGKSEQHERMMDLTVEIQGDIGTLEEALGKFTATEILDGENKYLCGRCKSYEKAKKKMTVLEAPNVLTIAFKRFQSGKFGKLNKSIRFPETLNLAPYMSVKSDKSHIYRLYGVVVHLDVMDAAFSGHYVCYIKNLQGKWFKIDDSTVKPVELERVLSKGAYMLLYSRCSPQPPSFIRNAMVSDGSKAKRDKSSEAIKTSNCTKDTTRARFNMAALRAGTSAFTAHKKPESYPHQMTLDGVSSFDSFNRRVHQINRAPMVDSSSDSSSLFSCSDEGSCSTESTRDSTSTDDLSEYIFGESRLGWNSPWRGSDASDVSCSSPFIRSSPSAVSHRNIPNSYGTNGYSSYNTTQMMDADGFSTRLHRDGREGLQETERAPFLYTDTSKNCRSSADHNYCSISHSSSNSETNIDQLGWGNPLDVKLGSSVRRPSWERTAQAQTFY